MQSVEIYKAKIEGRPYFAIIADGECWMQRADIASASEDPLAPYEKVLVRICEHMTQDEEF